MNLFDPDSKFSIVVNTIMDYVKLTMLMILFSLPIITIGPAATAVMSVAMKMERKEYPTIWKPFWTSFKANFKQGAIVTVICLAVTVLLVFDWNLMLQMESSVGVNILRGLTFIVTLVLFFAAMYLFPLLARFDQTIPQLFRNAVIFGLSNFARNLVIVAILVVGWALLYYAEPILPITLIATPAIGIWYLAKICVKRFRKSEERILENQSPEGGETHPVTP